MEAQRPARATRQVWRMLPKSKKNNNSFDIRCKIISCTQICPDSSLRQKCVAVPRGRTSLAARTKKANSNTQSIIVASEQSLMATRDSRKTKLIESRIRHLKADLPYIVSAALPAIFIMRASILGRAIPLPGFQSIIYRPTAPGSSRK